MIIAPIHHEPIKPEYKSPFSAAMAVEDAKLIFFSGCCTIPIYHKQNRLVKLAKDGGAQIIDGLGDGLVALAPGLGEDLSQPTQVLHRGPSLLGRQIQLP